MSNLTKGIVCIVLLATAFAFGRYTKKPDIKEVVKVQIVEKKVEVVATNTHTKTVEEIKPDGSKTTTTVADTSTSSQSNTDTNTKSESLKEVKYDQSGITISALGGIDYNHLDRGFNIGIAASKPVFGPISIGAWWLNNGNAGVSLGIKF